MWLAAQENPAARAITAERLFEREAEILKKKAAYIPDVTGDEKAQTERFEELKRKAAEKYRSFLASRPQERGEIARTYYFREQTRQIIKALGGTETSPAWERALPYGVCSAALLREAEEKHKERKAAVARELWAGGVNVHIGKAVEVASTTVAVESATEAAEANQLLWGLEKDLGYDFSEEHSKEPLPAAAARPTDSPVFSPPYASAGGYGGRIR